MNIPNRQPSDSQWHGQTQEHRHASYGSIGSRSRGSSTSQAQQNGDEAEGLVHRRSSVNLGFSVLRQMGGVNSLDNFARSWQRAASFHEITPLRPSFRFAETEEGEPSYTRGPVATAPQDGRSLIRAALENNGRRSSEQAFEEDAPMPAEHLLPTEHHTLLDGRLSWADSIFSVEPSLASPFGGSYGTMYGSRAPYRRESGMRHAARTFRENQVKSPPDKEREPLIVKPIEEDGITYNVIIGRSTLPQTVFNSVNVLVGVGLLSLPLAFHYSGWLLGITFFIFAVVSTQYTAKLLAKCQDVDTSLVTFGDLAYVSFGWSARIVVSILFSLELIAACVALVILFADSLNALIPSHGTLFWKIICCCCIVPLSFAPLSLLSYTSMLGVLSCFSILCCIIADGIIKPTSPGSFRQPASTSLFPPSWETLPLAFGLLMAPWGGHSVFPNIYRDMRHPYKYRQAVDITYFFTAILDFSMACIGVLLFGDHVSDEITSDILTTPGYPRAVSLFVMICIAVIPLSKVPLNARPIISTMELLTGLVPIPTHPQEDGGQSLPTKLLRICIRVGVVVLFGVIAVILPDFDRIMALLGSICCFTICIIFPVAYHLKLFGGELGRGEWLLNWALIVISTILAVISTIFACLPRGFFAK